MIGVLLAALAVVGLIVGYVFLRALGGMIGREAAGWAPHVARQVVRTAADGLPAEYRDRYREEWLAEVGTLSDRPLTALITAFSIARNARRLAQELAPATQPVANSPAPIPSIATEWLRLSSWLGPLQARLSRIRTRVSGSYPMTVRALPYLAAAATIGIFASGTGLAVEIPVAIVVFVIFAGAFAREARKIERRS